MRLHKLLATLAAILAGVTAVNAQNELSPYSQKAYGILSDKTTGAQRAMGGVGYAMNNGRQINAMNPASYAACDSLTFLWDIGFDMTNLWQTEDDLHGYTFGGGLDYIAMQFPITKNIGASIGLMPFSEVGYSFAAEIDEGTESRTGDGGINQLYAGAAYSFKKIPFIDNISLGFNFSYQFGTITNDNYTYTESSSVTQFEHVLEIRDWGIEFGLQMTKKFGRKHALTLGVTYTPPKDVHGKTWATYYNATSDSDVDTVGYQKMGGDFTYPYKIGVGLNYTYDQRFTVEADFTYQNWSDAKFKDIELFSSTELNDRYRAALGFQIIPKHRGNFIQRTSYRFGGYYTRDYISIRGNELREYGLAVGFGLPSMYTKTTINLGFELKHRETSPVNYISENYFNITLGVTFDEMWFWKNKIR